MKSRALPKERKLHLAKAKTVPVRERKIFSPQVTTYFEEITRDQDRWRRKTKSFIRHTSDFLKTTVRPGSRVLILGCPSWELLDALKPSHGVGLHVSKSLIDRFKADCKNPNLEFDCIQPDQVRIDEKFDYVIQLHLTEFSEDIFALMKLMKTAMHEKSVLIVSRTNPLWQPIVTVTSALGIRVPDWRKNFFSNDVIHVSLEAQGFRVQGEYNRQIVPRSMFGISRFVNTYLGRLPLLNRLGYVKYSFAKVDEAPPDELTCSVIVPCYNEEDNVRECALRVPLMGKGTEVIIVDDGSRDRTVEIAKKIEKTHPHVRCLVSERNQGKGKAVEKGLRAAKGDIVFILDADMTVPPEELTDFFDAIAYRAADFVSGTRFVYPMEDHAMRLANYFGNIAFSKLVQIIIGTPCTDTLCGTKVMRRKDFEDMIIEDNSWGDFDFIFHAAKRKLKSVQIPVHYKNRVAGSSKMKALSSGIRFLRLCLSSWGKVG